eukprot:1165729-Lingulodinium_polyedra.AAC.1
MHEEGSFRDLRNRRPLAGTIPSDETTLCSGRLGSNRPPGLKTQTPEVADNTPIGRASVTVLNQQNTQLG